MAEPERISVQEAREKVQSNAALLVCAYDDEQKFSKMKLEGAISLASLESRMSTLPKEQELIFYCG